MKKTSRIIYWIATVWLALGMVAGGVQQFFQAKGFVDIMVQLNYPLYLLYLLGVWKVLGSIAILLPRLPLLKEWAYAGFFFAMSGAVFSHLAVGDVKGIYAALSLLALTMISWYFRPADRKPAASNGPIPEKPIAKHQTAKHQNA